MVGQTFGLSLRNKCFKVGCHSDLSSLFGLVEGACEHVWERFIGKLGVGGVLTQAGDVVCQ